MRHPKRKISIQFFNCNVTNQNLNSFFNCPPPQKNISKTTPPVRAPYYWCGLVRLWLMADVVRCPKARKKYWAVECYSRSFPKKPAAHCSDFVWGMKSLERNGAIGLNCRNTYSALRFSILRCQVYRRRARFVGVAEKKLARVLSLTSENPRNCAVVEFWLGRIG